MTNEERIRGLEDAVILLSNIDQARFGAYAKDQCQGVPRYGAQVRKWIGKVNAHRAINPAPPVHVAPGAPLRVTLDG